jgi:hypothetical protein
MAAPSDATRPRFVVLFHRLPAGGERGDHWDLMFEAGGTLRTWALEAEPTAGIAIGALELPDHRLAYLDYEGPVSGDRGVVSRWDEGRYETIERDADHWRVRLAGSRVVGEARLARLDAQRWSVSFAPTGGESGAAAEG